MAEDLGSASGQATTRAAASSSEEAEGRYRHRPDGPRPKRDFWDYVDILARPVAGSLTALAIAVIGVMGNQTLREQQALENDIARAAQEAESQRATEAQDHRLFTELMSKREDAETALRKDMFDTILGGFFDPDSAAGADDISVQLLKLEMLALNFGESLSLTPLFVELDREIRAERVANTTFSKLEWLEQRDRLRSLARRVSGRQLSALAASGQIFEFDVPLDSIEGTNTFRWPDDSDDVETIGTEISDIAFDGIKRTYTFEFSNVSKKNKTVDVDVEIQTWDPETDEPSLDVIEMGFELNFFNFPMVDNTRLTSDQRFALIMERFGDLNIHVVGVTFRGMYSSQRDKPFLDDVINQLKRTSADAGTGATGTSPEEANGGGEGDGSQ